MVGIAGAAVKFKRGDLAGGRGRELHADFELLPVIEGSQRRRTGCGEQAHAGYRRSHSETDIGRSSAAASVRDRVAKASRTDIPGVGG